MAYFGKGGCGDGVAEEEKGFEPSSIECERFDKANPHTTTDLWRRAGEEEHCVAGGKLCGVELRGDGGVKCGKLLCCDGVEKWSAVKRVFESS